MDGNTICLVKNRSSSKVTYVIPNEGIRREFAPSEVKKISFGELEKLTYMPGGTALMAQFLQIQTPQAIEELNIHTEIEYNLNEQQIKELLTTEPIEKFMDALDFAPRGVQDLIKKYAVELPLENTAKIDYLKEKTGFDLIKALANIKAEKAEANPGKPTTATTGRRVAVEPAPEEKPVRRYNVVSKQE